MTELPTSGLQMRSLVDGDGTLHLSLQQVDLPGPGEHEVLVRVEAAPLNPSDLGLLLAGADLAGATFAGSGASSTVTAPIPPETMRALAGRIGDSLAVGNEGAGTVVVAGTSDAARSLLGKTVGLVGGATYSQYRCVPVAQCLEFPGGVTAADGASWFVNPMTVLGLLGTMRLEGHSALVHTAAASNLGQMLNRVCIADGIGLVNIVRSVEQEQLLRTAGAEYVCDSTAGSFADDLTAAIAATGATIAFDAVGGGRLAGQILSCMEAALLASASEYSRYGSTTHKQVYLYGNLDRGPTVLDRTFGMAWGIGGWLLMPYLARAGGEEIERMRRRVAAEITTTFASGYTRQVSLVEALARDAVMGYARQATGEKYLIRPNG
jgi:NADPH:quinone reductase-like Zn-dependent oxidoreductase